MKKPKLLAFVAVLTIFVFTIPISAQISTRTGSVFGKVLDDKGAPLPGVSITIESESIQSQTATSGPTGGFRFANLPPGAYSVTFRITGFTEVRQEDVRVSVGGSVELNITLKPTLQEEFVVVAETPVVDTKKTGNESAFNRDYLEQVPSGRDPWVIIEQTPGVDNDRINVAGSESGQQTSFFARGAADTDNAWNYDGVNATDPLSLGASPTYYDFDAFEEIQIASGGMDASIGAKGVVVNLVTKRAGNKWEANASAYYVNESLQSTNTPDELVAQGVERSNRIDQVYDLGFDIGGPIVKDKLFVWGAYRRNQIDLFTRTGLSDKTKLTDLNFKANFNWNSANESQFGYFNGTKEKDGRGFDPPNQSEETLWNQVSPETLLPGIITGQHTWIPNDHTIINGRYGYIGLSFALVPKGGNCAAFTPCDTAMIYLSPISLWEDTSFNVNPIDRPAHDFNVDMNWFKENWIGGDHEFKFGFEYKRSEGRTFSSYGNGVALIDFYQDQPRGPLTSGLAIIQHSIDGRLVYDRSSFYATDTWRMDRLTLNLGFRFDSDSGKNNPNSIPGVRGFENIVGPLDFPGNDFSQRFNNVSPRLGATYDLTGDGKTIIRGNYARYYDGYIPFYDQYRNPTYVYNGFLALYSNSNGDRLITPDELAVPLGYYGGLNGPIFDLESFYNSRILTDLSAPNTDEFVIGFEREVVKDVSVFGSFTYRNYKNFIADVPFGITPEDFVPLDPLVVETPYGTFTVPISTLGFEHDGTHILKNIEGYSQTYGGIDIGVRKRMSNDFMLNAFVTLQDQKAHYDGGDSFLVLNTGDGIVSFVNFTDPLAAPIFDDQPYAYASAGSGKTGVFPLAEWTFRMSGVYQLPADFSVGGFVRYQQGFPQPLFASIEDNNLANFYGTNQRTVLLQPIGDLRYDNIFTLDLNLQKTFQMSDYGRLTLALDMFNLTNSNTVVQRNRRTTSSTFDALQENLSPRAFRLGIKYGF